MRKLTVLAVVTVCQLVSAGESPQKKHVLGQWNQLQATYMIHSGSTAYSELPTKGDRAITVYFKGEAAKQLFDQMGPDVKEACSSEKGDRERRNKGAVCLYEAHLAAPGDSQYPCWIGIDLRTGDGSARVPC